jgi:RimJ/RimL family protein N-acetyltransferase
MTEPLRNHGIRLTNGSLVLRPIAEADWPILLPWHSDPEVLYFSEGNHATSRSLEEMQHIYRSVSQAAFVFIAELHGRPIGDAWLQKMNLPRVLGRYPTGQDLRRIDLEIGEKTLWGQGWGTHIIALLVRFGFDMAHADAIFGCDIGDCNPRSRRAFEKNGFLVDQTIPQDPGRKAREVYDMVLTRSRYEQVYRRT